MRLQAILLMKFQFHKVRLKDLVYLLLIGLGLFQFHKVRLKEKMGAEGILGAGNFNSIRYD